MTYEAFCIHFCEHVAHNEPQTIKASSGRKDLLYKELLLHMLLITRDLLNVVANSANDWKRPQQALLP